MDVADLDLGQLRALSAVVAEGTLEAAARTLHVTPSAVSQRLKALEQATGRVLLVRGRPARVTPSGEVVLRLARQVAVLGADAAAELGADGAGAAGPPAGRPIELAVAVNADSLATWVLPALAPLADRAVFDLHTADQTRTSRLLRDGTVLAAVTAEPRAVPGCSSRRLGGMRYRPVAAPGFVERWFPGGIDVRALDRAPTVVFDRADDMQDRYLRRRTRGRARPPRHHVPSSADFVEAVRLGLGWGMVPDLQRAEGDGLLVLDPRGTADVALHWQQWRLRSPSLDRLADAVVAAARAALTPP